nr:MAG TPA: hypothetical protein [Caudoviricetes sp.]
MTKVLTDPTYYTAIANAIRGKNGGTTTYKPSDMADAITALTASSTAGHTITLKQTEHQSIAANVSSLAKSLYSSDKADVVFDPDILDVRLYVDGLAGYWPGNLVINGEEQAGIAATVVLDKDYVVSATEAIQKADSYAIASDSTLQVFTGAAIGRDNYTNYTLSQDSGTCKATLSEADAAIMRSLAYTVVLSSSGIGSPIEVTFEGATISFAAPASGEVVLFATSEEEGMRIKKSLFIADFGA